MASKPISAFISLETGQPVFAFAAIDWNAAWSMPGILPVTVRWTEVMEKPSPDIGKLTEAGAWQQTREADGMIGKPASYRRHRCPAEIISHAVWLYHAFSLSLRDVELILAERNVVVTHASIRHWCQKFGADFAMRLRRRRPQPGDTWHLDEVFIRIS